MGNDLKPPSPEELAAANARAEAAERENQRLAGLANAALQRGAPAPAGPPEPDPLAVFSEKAATLSPEAATDLLNRGIEARVQNAIRDTEQRFGRVLGQTRAQDAYQYSLAAALEANPDIAEDQEGFYAAAARVQYQYTSRGQNPPPGAEFVRQSVRQYRKEREKPQPVDHVEGPGRGEQAKAPAASAPPAPESPGDEVAAGLAGVYGLDPSEVMTFNREGMAALEKMSRDYPVDKNEALEAKGIFSKVPKVELPARERRRARKQAAAAAAGG